MRILVHEFATGGGMAGMDVSPSLAREGRAMRDALVADVAAIGSHEVVVSVDPRFPCDHGVVGARFEAVSPTGREGSTLEELIDTVDAVWLVAPETAGCHEKMARRIERSGRRLIGSASDAIRIASDKAGLAGHLSSQGVRHPTTVSLPPEPTIDAVLESLTRLRFPIVVKPNRGAGAEGVVWFPDVDSLLGAIGQLPKDGLVQEYVSGQPVSVSLVIAGAWATAVALSSQELVLASPPVPAGFVYHGGITPFDHPDGGRARELALLACRCVPGLRGWVGVDLVLGPEGPVVIEINPRLTMSYLGVRRAIEQNPSAMVIDAVEGRPPAEARIASRVRFTECGDVVSVEAWSRTVPDRLTTYR